MNKTEKILALAIISIVILACNLGNTQPSVPAEPGSTSPAPEIQSSPTQAAAGSPATASDVEPCSLFTAAEAEAILSEPASAPNPMNGACSYSNAKDSLYMVSATAAQGKQADGILQGQAMMLGFAGGKLDEARMTKLKELAAAPDYKGFFTELVAAADGAATLKARLVENGGSDVVYWAWINAQSRRQAAFVAVRGQTVVNVNLIVAEAQTEDAMLAMSTSLADRIFGRLPAQFTLAMPAMPTVAPTPTLVLPVDTPVPPKPTIVGSWERRSSDVTEHFTIQADGSYSIEAKNNNTNAVVASVNGTLTFDENNIYYVASNNSKSTESYSLGNDGNLLVINNQVDKAWTRVQ
jgi:hypothetical protein